MWRSILITQGGKLSLKQNQLCIQQDVQLVTVPLEDIAIIVIESREVVITTALLSALALNGVTLLSCDDSFLPCGQWLPFTPYYRPLKTLKLQLEASLSLKKKIWQRIVWQKIKNQAFVLRIANKTRAENQLIKMLDKVSPGDKDNIESQAAMLYFPELFGKKFHRLQENSINTHLNYTYTILRSAIARSLVLHGWLPVLGFFHRNEYNAFNLADDFIEPFRPLADLLVWQLWQEEKLPLQLSPQSKQALIRILNYQMQCKNQVVNTLTAIDRTIGLLQSTLLKKKVQLLILPNMLLLKEHKYE